MTADTRTTLDAYFRGINEERYEDVAALFAPEGELRAPGIAPTRGRDALAGYFRAALRRYPQHEDRPTRTIVAGSTATVEIRFNGALASGAKVEFEAVDVFDFDEHGRIVLLTSWYDSHAVRAMLRAAGGVSDAGGAGQAAASGSAAGETAAAGAVAEGGRR